MIGPKPRIRQETFVFQSPVATVAPISARFSPRILVHGFLILDPCTLAIAAPFFHRKMDLRKLIRAIFCQ